MTSACFCAQILHTYHDGGFRAAYPKRVVNIVYIVREGEVDGTIFPCIVQHAHTKHSVLRTASTPRCIVQHERWEGATTACLHACMRAFSSLGGRRRSASCQNLEFSFFFVLVQYTVLQTDRCTLGAVVLPGRKFRFGNPSYIRSTCSYLLPDTREIPRVGLQDAVVHPTKGSLAFCLLVFGRWSFRRRSEPTPNTLRWDGRLIYPRQGTKGGNCGRGVV